MISLFDSIKNLFLPQAKFSKLEKVVFDAVREKLHDNEIELWDRQLAAVNRIHRSPDELEINLYSMRNGKSEFPEDICFENKKEFKVAVVDVKSSDNKVTLRGRVWCVNGHVFSIEYKTSFKEFEKITNGQWFASGHLETSPSESQAQM